MKPPQSIYITAISIFLAMAGLVTRGFAAEPSQPLQPPRVEDAEHFVTISFWRTSDCSGDPVATNNFPVDYADQRCYSWPGRSGANSATRFSCGFNSFTYTQWTTLGCNGGMNPPGRVKTTYTDQCTRDVPPTLHARITDFSGCTGSN